jgi:hypothetical protein
VSDIDTVVVDGLKALDLERPIREADIERRLLDVRLGPQAEVNYRAKTSENGSVEPFPAAAWLAKLPSTFSPARSTIMTKALFAVTAFFLVATAAVPTAQAAPCLIVT